MMMLTGTTTAENFVSVSAEMQDESYPWRSIAEHSTEPDDQSWFWTTAWQEEEKEATLEIQMGQLSKPLYGVEEIRQHLSEL